MSKLLLLNEIITVVKMASKEIEEVKLSLFLDDLLTNYSIEPKDERQYTSDNADYLCMYINAIKIENYSDTTITNYQYELKRFLKFINKSLLKVETADIRKYLAEYGHLKSGTVATKLTIIRAFYAWLVREEILLKNPTLRIKQPKVPKRLREGLTIEELELVRESCDSLRQRALIEVLYSTACRLSELKNLNIEDINWQDMSAVVIGKGNKERRVFFSFKALYHLKRYLKSRNDECNALFVTSRHPIRRLTNRGIQYQVNKIEQLSQVGKPLTPHVMRHTFATLSMDSGIELTDLQHLLGHEDPATTLRYAPVSEERKKQAFKKYHVQ
ncbi:MULTISPECIES: tyrosine-type recombinase/integrase [Lysinibacillus]|uniref:tyrosine-type recombinase/integrase n=1 Tax=Lysinibacillus TaxID=400634 RepID=UPI00214C2738|nr:MULTISPECIES: tyrosine-type recombinase/integrase [Lysinibacillus]UUV26126.1 tyrosine-type recombinase/integrase [Lysinibacillus sp. FN11]UYB48999.1 tyrosine-type recombinase/integrase [Lysinibacillus capsici]